MACITALILVLCAQADSALREYALRESKLQEDTPLEASLQKLASGLRIISQSEQTMFIVEPKTLSIEGLRSNLSSGYSISFISGFGGYIPDTYEKELLYSALIRIEVQGYNAGFILMDLTSGYGVAYNADKKFYSASSIKGIYVASLAAWEPSTIYYLADSMYATIHYSSNDDYFYLRFLYGDDPYVKWCEDAGVETPIIGEWFPYFSSRTLAKLWLRNYEYFESHDEGVDEVFSHYTSTQNSAIYNSLGEKYQICSKSGWIGDEEYSSTVDAGIIYADGHPYLMVIMSDVPGEMDYLNPLVLALEEIHSTMPGVHS